MSAIRQAVDRWCDRRGHVPVGARYDLRPDPALLPRILAVREGRPVDEGGELPEVARKAETGPRPGPRPGLGPVGRRRLRPPSTASRLLAYAAVFAAGHGRAPTAREAVLALDEDEKRVRKAAHDHGLRFTRDRDRPPPEILAGPGAATHRGRLYRLLRDEPGPWTVRAAGAALSLRTKRVGDLLRGLERWGLARRVHRSHSGDLWEATP